MSTRKRGRDEDDDEDDVNRLEPPRLRSVKSETIVKLILEQMSEWSDSCGCKYEIEHKVIKEKDSIILKTGFFDSLSCSQIWNAATIELPLDYGIKTFDIDLEKRILLFYVQRCGDQTFAKTQVVSTGEECGTNAQNAGTSAKSSDSHTNNLEMLKLRLMHQVKPEDTSTVHKHVTKMLTLLPNATYKLSQKANSYGVIFSCKENTVTAETILYAKQLKGIIDLDHKQFMIDLKKQTPDIVD